MQNLIDRKNTNILKPVSRDALSIILSHLNREVSLVTIVDNKDPKSVELKDFVLEIAELNDLITVEVYDKGENPDMENTCHADKFPILALLDSEKYYSGVKYHAIPSKEHLMSFGLTLYNLGGPGLQLDTETAEKILALQSPMNIKICVSLSCPACGDTTAAAVRIALLNPRIQAEMIDINLFPEIQQKYNIHNVPALIINDEIIHYDVKTMDEIIEVLSL